MTFPEKKYEEISSFADDYFDRITKASNLVDRDKLVQAANVLERTYKENQTLYVCGNGGSAATAGTFVCDHTKLVQTDTSLTARVVSLSGNMSMLTAIANDLSYDDVFLFQLKTLANSGDVLLAISASGNSANPYFLVNVTFLTSIMFLSHKKSNLVSFGNLNSGLITFIDLNSFMSLFFNPFSTILFARCVFTPIITLFTSIISKVNFNFL